MRCHCDSGTEGKKERVGVTIMGEQGKAPRVGTALHLDRGAGLTVRGRCTLSKRVCLKPEEPGVGSED